jgi:hypothetical protein
MKKILSFLCDRDKRGNQEEEMKEFVRDDRDTRAIYWSVDWSSNPNHDVCTVMSSV